MAIEKFGFTVRKDDDGKFMVYLPHQCDHWDITGDSNYSQEGADQLAAMGEFAKFLDEAREAFEALSRGEEFA